LVGEEFGGTFGWRDFKQAVAATLLAGFDDRAAEAV
jgi:hypothetical protein